MDKKRNLKLTEKQEKFSQEYIVDFNGSAAVLRAGYKTKYPNRIASQLLDIPRLQERIKELQQPIKKKKIVSEKKESKGY